jgi:hypothetical protein
MRAWYASVLWLKNLFYIPITLSALQELWLRRHALPELRVISKAVDQGAFIEILTAEELNRLFCGTPF